MPINKKYPIETLTAIAARYFEKTGRRVTFEYVVIPGETDTDEAARNLKKLLGFLTCKINLIPLNPIHEAVAPLRRRRWFASRMRCTASAFRRPSGTSRGRDIGGACGQLTAHEYARAGAADRP